MSKSKSLSFTPKRLLDAIEKADLTYQEAAELMGLSANSITKYVNGDATPTRKLAAVEKFINTGRGTSVKAKPNGKSKPKVNGTAPKLPKANPRREFLASIAEQSQRFYAAQAREAAAKVVAAVEKSLG